MGGISFVTIFSPYTWGLIVIEINTFYSVWSCSRFGFFLTAGEPCIPLSAFFSPSTPTTPSCADKTEPRKLFPACAWHLLLLSEVKATLLCPKSSLSLRVVVCFPPLWHSPTHLPSREVFPRCFSFLLGEFLASQAALGSSGTGPAQVALQTALFIAPSCRLPAQQHRPTFAPKQMLRGFVGLAPKTSGRRT